MKPGKVDRKNDHSPEFERFEKLARAALRPVVPGLPPDVDKPPKRKGDADETGS